MCYNEFIREKKIGKYNIKYDASEHLALTINNGEFEDEIHIDPNTFDKIIKFYKETIAELEEDE
jgi:hypothetical protein